MCINPKDRCVRSVDERLQLLCYSRLLHLHLLPLSNVLTHANHAHNSSTDVAASSGVQQHLHALTILGVERELEVGRLAAL
jgi:hypothetical protein